MIEKEFERKLLVSENDYVALLHTLDKNFKSENILQINYYYDTLDFALFHGDETLRVRQIGGVLKLQYKYNKTHSVDVRISDEYSEKITELPKSIIIRGFEAHNVGFMVTERTNFNLENCILSLDKNYYLGILDYEIEVETEKETYLPDMLREYNFTSNSVGKYSRFVEKLLKQGFVYEQIL